MITSTQSVSPVELVPGGVKVCVPILVSPVPAKVDDALVGSYHVAVIGPDPNTVMLIISELTD